MSKIIDGIVIPDNPQQGAWYSGRQYWNGTLSQPGFINSQSNQQGAGQAVSQEVNKQTSVAAGLAPDANQKYIEQQRALAYPTGKSAPSAVASAGNTAMPDMGAGAGDGVGLTEQTSFNLPNLYKKYYDESGISVLEADVSAKEKAYIEQKGKTNDNPFLSEATRVGRIAKIDKLYNENVQSIKNDIAVKKADIETKLNLETKQFDINSQAARDALSKFNTLLGMGALDTASGADIANLVRSTGLSSAAIQSAITANKAKNVKTQVIQSTADDGTVTASVINAETGEIIKSTSLGRIGNAQNGEKEKSASQGEQKTSAELDVQKYLTTKELQSKVSPEDLYLTLIQAYPEAIDYIKSNWTPTLIRVANGEKKPYGKTPL
jgi:hypothetical protein